MGCGPSPDLSEEMDVLAVEEKTEHVQKLFEMLWHRGGHRGDKQ